MIDPLPDCEGGGGTTVLPGSGTLPPAMRRMSVEMSLEGGGATTLGAGKVNLASSGIGTSVHLSGALFMMMTGLELVHVPYRGAAPALTDLLANQVQVMFDNLPSSIGHIQGGRLRALAVTTTTPSKALPGVPTVAETVPGYEASAWFGMAVPKGTPRPIIEKLNRVVNEALADPGMQAKLADLGGVLIPGTPEDFGKVIAAETAKWAKVVQATGATAE